MSQFVAKIAFFDIAIGICLIFGRIGEVSIGIVALGIVVVVVVVAATSKVSATTSPTSASIASASATLRACLRGMGGVRRAGNGSRCMDLGMGITRVCSEIFLIINSNTEACLQLVVGVVLCVILRLIAIDLLAICGWQSRHNQRYDVTRDCSRTLRVGVTELYHPEHTLSEYTAGRCDRVVARVGPVFHLEAAQEGCDLGRWVCPSKEVKRFWKNFCRKSIAD